MCEQVLDGYHCHWDQSNAECVDGPAFTEFLPLYQKLSVAGQSFCGNLKLIVNETNQDEYCALPALERGYAKSMVNHTSPRDNDNVIVMLKHSQGTLIIPFCFTNIKTFACIM